MCRIPTFLPDSLVACYVVPGPSGIDAQNRAGFPMDRNSLIELSDRQMRFTKMHGIGNDYVYLSTFDQDAPADPAKLAVAVSDRHYGIGGDGLILIMPSDRADARMRMFNADGSEGEMCGNGERVRVDMGAPILDPARIPPPLRGEPPIDVPITVGGRTLEVTAVSMG